MEWRHSPCFWRVLSLQQPWVLAPQSYSVWFHLNSDVKRAYLGPRSRFPWSFRRCCHRPQDHPASSFAASCPLVACHLNLGLDCWFDQSMAASRRDQYRFCDRWPPMLGWLYLELWWKGRLCVVLLVRRKRKSIIALTMTIGWFRAHS
jgi:hypothetical protein